MRLNDPGALAMAEKAARLAPTDANALDTLGWLQARSGALALGLKTLREARLRAPDSREVRYHLAWVLHRSGKRDEARDELAAVFRSQGDFESQAEAQTLRRELGCEEGCRPALHRHLLNAELNKKIVNLQKIIKLVWILHGYPYKRFRTLFLSRNNMTTRFSRSMVAAFLALIGISAAQAASSWSLPPVAASPVPAILAIPAATRGPGMVAT
jgi:tetratricopeptide (TPR) repeat protein